MSCPISNFELVDPVRGNDATGKRNDTSKPFQTIFAANAASQNGDTIYCLAGHHRVDQSIVLKDNCFLVGQGIDVTFLDWFYSGNLGLPCVQVANNTYTADLTITSGVPFLVGVHLQSGLGSNNNNVGGAPGATGFVVVRVKINMATQRFGISFQSTNAYVGQFLRCNSFSDDISGKSDLGPHDITLYDCQLRTSDVISPTAGACWMILSAGIGNIARTSFVDCEFITVAGADCLECNTVTGAGQLIIIRCDFTNVLGAGDTLGIVGADVPNTFATIFDCTIPDANWDQMFDDLGSGEGLNVYLNKPNLSAATMATLAGEFVLNPGWIVRNTTIVQDQIWNGAAWVNFP